MSCRTKKETQFELLNSSKARDFKNLIAETDTWNLLGFEYIYNGTRSRLGFIQLGSGVLAVGNPYTTDPLTGNVKKTKRSSE